MTGSTVALFSTGGAARQGGDGIVAAGQSASVDPDTYLLKVQSPLGVNSFSLFGSSASVSDCGESAPAAMRAFISSIAACGFTSGVLMGYAAYMYIHHATHHMQIGPDHWLYQARLRHMAHHYADQYNFGVSTGFWDRVFGTVRAKRDRFA